MKINIYAIVKPSKDEKLINNHKHLEEFVNKISKASKKETQRSVAQITSRLFLES